MPIHPTDEDSRLSLWLRVREYAVPPSMIETATARRSVGDWAGACAAAGFDTDLHLPSVARTHGRTFATRLRADLRHLAPDLLRWHMPRTAPDGLLRPGLTVALARYDGSGRDDGSARDDGRGRDGGSGRDAGEPVYLVARTPPAWADAGQRIVLTLWDGTRSDTGTRNHPHPRPSRRFRLDLHRHLWDARSADELRHRSGAGGPPADRPAAYGPAADGPPVGVPGLPHGPLHRCAVDRWAAEARLLLAADGLPPGPVEVRLGGRHRLILDPDTAPGAGPGGSAGDDGTCPATGRGARPPSPGGRLVPVLPDAATWVPPDLELLRAGVIEADRLHPLVARSLVPGHVPAVPGARPHPADEPRFVDCRGSRHRIGLVDGTLVPLDHDPGELRREELLVALSGTPLPCLRVIDQAHRSPASLSGIRERLAHGDTAGALAVVEGLLGPGAVLRDGALRDELEAAAEQRITYGLFRAGLIGPGPGDQVHTHRPYAPRRRTRRYGGH